MTDHRKLTLAQVRNGYVLRTACEACQEGWPVDLGQVPTALDAMTVREIHFGCHLHCPTCGLPVASTRIYTDHVSHQQSLGGFSGWTRWRVVHSTGPTVLESGPEGV